MVEVLVGDQHGGSTGHSASASGLKAPGSGTMRSSPRPQGHGRATVRSSPWMEFSESWGRIPVQSGGSPCPRSRHAVAGLPGVDILAGLEGEVDVIESFQQRQLLHRPDSE